MKDPVLRSFTKRSFTPFGSCVCYLYREHFHATDWFPQFSWLVHLVRHVRTCQRSISCERILLQASFLNSLTRLESLSIHAPILLFYCSIITCSFQRSQVLLLLSGYQFLIDLSWILRLALLDSAFSFRPLIVQDVDEFWSWQIATSGALNIVIRNSICCFIPLVADGVTCCGADY